MKALGYRHVFHPTARAVPLLEQHTLLGENDTCTVGLVAIFQWIYTACLLFVSNFQLGRDRAPRLHG